MKRREFVRELISRGCYLKRHGGNHDIYYNPQNGRVAPVPRHAEVKDSLARAIRKQLGLGVE
ncbi:MAG: type II toxin-antitoxin system HicA family toxin [Verrucomicrobia bacterium]|nr:type II toxin-antitoxin system HicA family toxin [Verrucomicrobiota bacterium]